MVGPLSWFVDARLHLVLIVAALAAALEAKQPARQHNIIELTPPIFYDPPHHRDHPAVAIGAARPAAPERP